MKRRIIVFLCSFLGVTAGILLAVTVLSTYYYKNVFTFGTWINGNYCTGMTAQEVSDLLLEQYTCFEYDLTTMQQVLLEQEWMNSNLYNAQNTVSIVKTLEDGYILVDETKNLLNQEKAIQIITDSIVNELTEIDLRKECYIDIPYDQNMLETIKKWKGIESFQNFCMTYDFGDRQELIDKSVVCDWIALDEDGYIIYDENNFPVLDESMIEEYVAYLGSVYNTVGIERSFHTTRGDVVKVAGGSYGNELNEKAEFQYLKNAFLNKESGVRIPEYVSEAFTKGSDDIGNTYIEIDMGNQMMYYYQNGKLVLESPVVTGNMKRNWGTPSKVCYVYYKQKNRVLRGANYATPVKYWMAVDGHIGIHDASWRKEFGGEIYLTDGSHGCINTPLEKVRELYDMVEIGTPVIMFY